MLPSKRFAAFVLLGTLLILFSVAPATVAPDDEYNRSPLTDPDYTWNLVENETLGLEWYDVSPWEVEVCTRGLSSTYGQSPTNEVVDLHLVHPIYRDTITLTAQRRVAGEQTYYELGFYVQPFEGDYKAKVVVENRHGQNHTVESGSVSESGAFEGYAFYPDPCDPDVHDCLPISHELERVRLIWWPAPDGPKSYLVSRFRLLNNTVEE